jgi:hypothetical protein
MREPSFDRRLDEVGREEGKRDRHVDLADAAAVSRRDAFRIRSRIGDEFIEPFISNRLSNSACAFVTASSLNLLFAYSSERSLLRSLCRSTFHKKYRRMAVAQTIKRTCSIINRDCFGNRWLPQTTCANCTGSSGDFLPSVTTSREDHRSRRLGSAQSGTAMGARHNLWIETPEQATAIFKHSQRTIFGRGLCRRHRRQRKKRVPLIVFALPTERRSRSDEREQHAYT